MSSLTLSTGSRNGDAHHELKLMAHAMTDRSPQWAFTPPGSTTAAAVGAESQYAADTGIRLLDNGLRLVMDGPAWLRAELDPIARLLEGSDCSLPKIAAVLAGVSGDAHCAVLTEDGGAVVYRGQMAARPLFYTVRGDGTILVASRIRGIRAAEPGAEISAAGLAPFLVPAMCDPAGTAWDRVRRLPPGHALIATGKQVTIKNMGSVRSPDLDGADREDLVMEFRRRLLTAMERCSGPPDVVLLSGGIDSAALTCAAVAAGINVDAYSLTYGTEALAACDERRYVDDVENSTGVPVTRVPAENFLPLQATYPLGDEPEAWTYAARNWEMLTRIAANKPQATVIAGEGGDELLLGQIFTVADRHTRGDTVGAERELATFSDPAAAQRIVDHLLAGTYNSRRARVMRALADIPPWLSSRYLVDTALVDRLAGGYPQLRQHGRMSIDYSRQLIAEAGAAGRVHCGGWWEDTGRRAGVSIRYPFLDPDLAALTWALPPQLIRNHGVEKVVLRDALVEELPASIATRLDKADARAMMHTGLRDADEQLRAVAHGGPLVDRDIINPTKLLAAIEEYLAGDDRHGPSLWATVSVNSWMHHEETAP